VAGSPSSYGPNLRALAGYLVLQHILVERCAQLIAEATEANISPRWAAGVLEEAAGLAADSGHTLIRALLTLVHVLHADETATRIG
jgi:transposase